MSRARENTRRASDWSLWFPEEGRDAEMERLRRELAASRERERKVRREAEEVKERFRRVLGFNRRFLDTLGGRRDRQHINQQRLGAQRAVGGVLGKAADLADAAEKVLKVLSRSLGWQRAVLWTFDEAAGALRCDTVWPKAEGEPDGFESACRKTSFTKGEGLPGRAWAHNRVVWTGELEKEAGGNAEAVLSEGLRGALAFPISAGGRCFGVIELLDEDTLEPDKELHYTVGLIGAQIGRFVERRAVEAELEQSRRLFRRIADASPDILYLYDLIEERNVYVNRGVEQVLGYAPEQIEAMGDNLMPHLLHPDDLQIAVESIRTLNAQEEGEVNETEYRMRHADGTYRWLQSHEVAFTRAPDGRVQRILGLAQNVTEQKKTAEALAESEERLRLATEAGRVGVVEWDLQTNSSRCSEVMIVIFGYPPSKRNPSYADFLERVHPEDYTRVRHTLDTAVAAGAPHELEFRIVRPDGEERHVRSIGRVHKNEEGVPVRVVGITQDITEQKKAEEERERLRALEVATRTEGVERARISRELHDRVAHEMGVVHQSLQLYEALQEKDPDRAWDRLQTAKKMVQHSLGQTRNLSAELRRSETEKGLIPALRDLLEVAVPDEVRTELHASGEEALLSEQQRGQLYLILREAIRNAVRHSGGSRISVGLDITPEEALGYVEDDGRGFGANGGSANGGSANGGSANGGSANGESSNNGESNGNERDGIGLQAIQERAALVGGKTQTYPVPEGGAGVEVRVPIHTRGGVIWSEEETR